MKEASTLTNMFDLKQRIMYEPNYDEEDFSGKIPCWDAEIQTFNPVEVEGV